MKKDPQILLQHILESIEWVEKDVQQLSEAEFYKNVPMQDAVVRRLEIIGEAVRNLPSDFKDIYPVTPWLDIADMRNKLIHEYFDVDLELVWEVIQKDLPPLKKQVEELLHQEG
jgi:uncharacterized protein with HEPN domain